MNVPALSQMTPNDNLLIEIGSNIWLMDDHRWAIVAWDRACCSGGADQACLIHADFHWDSVNDFHKEPELEARLIGMSSPELFEFVKNNEWIRYDSFIAPAIIRGLISEVHFFCKQNDMSDVGIDTELLNRFNASQHIHESQQTVSQIKTSRPIIFDLCLDLFNESQQYHGSKIWPDNKILEFLNVLHPIIQRACIVTVSLSFGYSGTESDTRRLAQLVLPVLKRLRHAS